jgi:hypothetical protein
MSRLWRPSPSMVVALIALAVALGGTSYAASRLPRNSVGGTQLRNNSVTSPKVKDGSLTSGDFGPGQLPRGPQGDRGPQGLQGLQGERGLQGATGTVDTSNFFDKAASDARYLPIAGIAADAGKLGGLPASAYLRGTGSRHFSSGFIGTVAPGSTSDGIANLGSAVVSCSGSGTTASTKFQFNTGVAGTVWTDSGAANPTVENVAAAGASTAVTTTAADHVEFAVQGGGVSADIDVWVNVNAGCAAMFRDDSTH